MKYVKLSDIASIHSGLVLSRKEAGLDAESIYKYKQLNLRSVLEDGQLNTDMLDDFFSDEEIKEVFITRKNDIVIRLFAPIHPILITDNYSGLVVPSQFVKLRIKTQDILPEFLYLHLSRNEIINDICAKEGGRAMRSIRISTLSDLLVPMPPLKKQNMLASFQKAHNKRKKLYFELLNQYDTHTNAVIKRLIEGEA